MTKRRLAVFASVAAAGVLGVCVYLWVDRSKEPPPPPDDPISAEPLKEQTPLSEEPEKQEPPPKEQAPPPVEEDNGQKEDEAQAPPQTRRKPPPRPQTAEEAWEIVNNIKENLHEWGTFSPEAEKIMDILMPVWTVGDEREAEESLKLLKQLFEYRDPRSAEVVAAYIFESNGLSPLYFGHMIQLGPPSIPFIMPYFKMRYPYNKWAAEVFIPIWQSHRELLDGVAQHIVIPELERSPDSRKMQYLREYLNQLKAGFER